MKGWTTVGAIAVLAACGAQSELQTAPSSAVVGDTTFLELPVGTSASAGEIIVAFDSVLGDSRCPTGVQCVWAGNGEVRLTLTRGVDVEAVGLNTTVEPRETAFFGYLVTLRELAPYPVYDEPLDPEEYVATIAVVETP
jgi:hypothetical protein